MEVLAKKKIIFIIVEGPSDQEALGLLLNKFFYQSNVVVHVTYGDITSKTGVNPENIRKHVAAHVKKYAEQYYLKQKDF